jgi:hypothetical protein
MADGMVARLARVLNRCSEFAEPARRRPEGGRHRERSGKARGYGQRP